MATHGTTHITLLGLGNIGYPTAKRLIENYSDLITIDKVLVTSLHDEDKDFYLSNASGFAGASGEKPTNMAKAEKLGLQDRIVAVSRSPMDAAEFMKHCGHDVNIVVDTTGNDHAAKAYVDAALRAGKHVVTATKTVMAKHGESIKQLATSKDLMVKFEACVGGPIPIIRTIQEYFQHERISKIVGILNGTSNYFLTELKLLATRESKLHKSEEQRIIKQLVAEGLAEPLRDGQDVPSADFDGTDIVNKLAILASVAFQTTVTPELILANCVVEGLSEQLRSAEMATLLVEMGKYQNADRRFVLKLIAIAETAFNELRLGIYPCLIPEEHFLALVEKECNGIWVHGNTTQCSFFYGLGAGPEPTATAVVADILDIANKLQSGTLGHFAFREYGGSRLQLVNTKKKATCGGFLIAYSPSGKKGVNQKKSQILADIGLNIFPGGELARHADVFKKYGATSTPDYVEIPAEPDNTEECVSEAVRQYTAASDVVDPEYPVLFIRKRQDL